MKDSQPSAAAAVPLYASQDQSNSGLPSQAPAAQPAEREAEHPTKRQRVESTTYTQDVGTGQGEDHGSAQFLDAGEDEGETRERVPMARSSMCAPLLSEEAYPHSVENHDRATP